MKDPIERRDALDAICDNCDTVKASCPHYPCGRYVALEKLPSAQPEQKKGEPMRLIDGDALYKKLNDIRKQEVLIHGRSNNKDCCTLSTALSEIDHAPTIEERKKGKWIKKLRVTETEKYISYDSDWCCSCCGTKYDSFIAEIVNFCYVCGADMRGEKNEGD